MKKTAANQRAARVVSSGVQRRVHRRFRLQPLALALAFAIGTPLALQHGFAEVRAQALPSGLNVVQGQASVAVSGNRMTVTNSANALLNWQSFSVGAGNAVRFEQPSAASQVLNRVVGNDPSNIFGSISSNGKVWLLNPNGVLFGRDARVNVAGLVTSTLNISNADWQAQRLSLSASNLPGANRAEVVNQGELRSAAGGRILLLGGAGGVRNEGLVEAPGGQVVLAAGHSMDLIDSGLPNLVVRVQAPQGQALNLGSLSAAGGLVDLSAAIVNQQGIVRADSIGGTAGQVVLRASESLNTGVGSLTSANGGAGGQVTLDAGDGAAMLAGRVEAVGHATQGGAVKLLGRQVGLLDGATVDASGRQRGGEVLIGGGAQGKVAEVPNAQAVYMDAAAGVKADATERGDGGSIVLWSNQATRVFGSLSARGGPAGGNGGFIETSGGWLDARPASLRTDAPQGRAGTWLLDPNNILITDSAAVESNITGGPDFRTTGNGAVLLSGSIVSALNAGNNVTVTTGSASPSSQAGDITVSSAHIGVAPGSPVSLTLTASRNIDLVSSTISSTGSPLGVNLRAAAAGVGTIVVDNSTIATAGGNINLGGLTQLVGPTATSPFTGAVGYNDPSSIYPRGTAISIVGSALNAGSGSLTMRGASTAVGTDAYGVRVSSGSTINAAAVDIKGWVNSAGSAVIGTPNFTNRTGASISGNVTSTGPLAIEGTAISPVFHANSSVAGTRIDGGVTLIAADSSNPALSLIGTVNDRVPDAASYGERAGVYLDPFSRITAKNGADLTIQGNNTSNNGYHYGVFSQASTIDASRARNLLITSPDGKVALFDYFDGQATSLTNVLTPRSGNPWGATRLDIVAGDIRIGGAGISGSPDQALIGGSGNLEVTGSSVLSFTGPAALKLQGSNIQIGCRCEDFPQISSTSGPIQLLADNLTIYAGRVTGSSTGNAITVAGNSNPNTHFFGNSAGSAALFAPNGRWLIYSDQPSSIDAGGLVHDFRQYNALYGSAVPAGSGNGLLFGLAPTLTVVNGAAITKTYDGNTAVLPASASLQLTGLVDSDRASGTLTYSALNYADKNVGRAKSITVSGFGGLPSIVDAGGKTAYGYAVAGFDVIGDVTPKTLTLRGVSAASKVYDGTTTATLVGSGALTGLVGSETLTFVPTGQFDTKDAGTGKTVNLTGALANGANGGLAANYALAGGSATTTADITRKPLTLSGVAAADKAYDGNTAATLTGVLTGLVGSERLTFSPSGQFDTKDAGTGKTVTGTVALADGSNGGLAANYSFAGTGVVTTTAAITPKPLTLSGVSAANKVYDGNTTATLVGSGALTGLVGSESLTFNPRVQFENKNAGTGKAVNVTVNLGNGANGGLAANYTTSGGTVTTANITQRDISVTAATAADKIYDASAAATVTGWTLSGAIAGDQVSVASGSGVFADPNVGQVKPVTATATALGGSDGANYRLVQPVTTALASVTPATLTYVAKPVTIFEGQPLAGFSVAVTGLVGPDTLQSATSGTPVVLVTAGARLPGSYPLIGSGLAATNYTFAQDPGNATALVIAASPRPILPDLTNLPVLPPPRFTTATDGRTSDVLQALTIDPAGGIAFGSLDVGNLSLEQLTTLLVARETFKKSLFGEAVRLLENDPALADAPACLSVEQVDTGTCLVTEELKAKITAAAAAEATSVAPKPATVASTTAPAALPPATATATATATAPPTSATPPAAPAAARTATAAAAPPVVAVSLPSQRVVRQASLPQIQRKIAVVIGNDNFEDKRIPKLDNARADAEAIAKVLGDELGYETLVIRDGTREVILATLNRLALQVKPNDSVVVYYAGHGELVEKTGLGYWQPANADATRPQTWISNDDIGKLLGQMGASQVALISDSCFSGSLLTDDRIRALGQTVDPTILLNRRAAVVMSSGGNEPVADAGKNGHSSFAWNLMRSLEKVTTWRPGGNVFEQVRFAVARELPQRPRYGAARLARHEAGSDYLFEQRRLEGLAP